MQQNYDFYSANFGRQHIEYVQKNNPGYIGMMGADNNNYIQSYNNSMHHPSYKQGLPYHNSLSSNDSENRGIRLVPSSQLTENSPIPQDSIREYENYNAQNMDLCNSPIESSRNLTVNDEAIERNSLTLDDRIRDFNPNLMLQNSFLDLTENERGNLNVSPKNTNRNKKPHAENIVFPRFNNRFSKMKLIEGKICNKKIGFKNFMKMYSNKMIDNMWEKTIIPRYKPSFETPERSRNLSPFESPNRIGRHLSVESPERNRHHFSFESPEKNRRHPSFGSPERTRHHPSIRSPENSWHHPSFESSERNRRQSSFVSPESSGQSNYSIKTEPIDNSWETSINDNVLYNTNLSKTQLKKFFYDPYKIERCYWFLKNRECHRDLCFRYHRLPKEDGVVCQDYALGKCSKSTKQCNYLHILMNKVSSKTVDDAMENISGLSAMFDESSDEPNIALSIGFVMQNLRRR